LRSRESSVTKGWKAKATAEKGRKEKGKRKEKVTMAYPWDEQSVCGGE